MNQKILVLSIVCLTLVMVTAIIAYAVLHSQETDGEVETTEETTQDNSESQKEETEKIYNDHKQKEASSKKTKPVESTSAPVQSNKNTQGSNNTSTQSGQYTEAQIQIQQQIKQQQNQVQREEYYPAQFLRLHVDHKYKNILAKNLKVNGAIISSATYIKYLGAKIKVDFFDAQGGLISVQYYQISNMIFPGATEYFEFTTQGGIPKNATNINYTVVEAYPYKDKMY